VITKHVSSYHRHDFGKQFPHHLGNNGSIIGLSKIDTKMHELAIPQNAQKGQPSHPLNPDAPRCVVPRARPKPVKAPEA
jgi:hypothetical protein